ncbi:MAG: hypothetical protein R3324_14385, partial [Halobacteriales archaeon]|nr:hypothetical protein [Halobacteriales archaeon]
LLGIAGLLHGAGLTLTTAVPLGALVAAALIGHAMFVNAPGSATSHTPGTSAPSSPDTGPAVQSAD